MEDIQAYIFENKEEIKEVHYLEIMKLLESSYRTNTTLCKITFLYPVLTEGGNDMDFTLGTTWAPLTAEHNSHYKKHGTLTTKVLLDMESVSLWVTDAANDPYDGPIGPVELDIKELPVLNILPPTTAST